MIKEQSLLHQFDHDLITKDEILNYHDESMQYFKSSWWFVSFEYLSSNRLNNYIKLIDDTVYKEVISKKYQSLSISDSILLLYIQKVTAS